MNQINGLKNIIGQIFPCNLARLNCFVGLLLALFCVRTVNLSEIAVAFRSRAEVSSRYKRLQRFFREFKIDYVAIASWVLQLFLSDKQIYLTIDRTAWLWGKAKINVLTLGIAYEGVAIPVLWRVLPKRGNATAKEHQELIQRFVSLFGKESIAGVLADREFASGDLLCWLNTWRVPFYIRLKENALIKLKGRRFHRARRIFSNLRVKTQRFFGMDVELFGQKVFLAGSRSERGELMIVATNRSPKNAIALYLRRWEIETLFACLKSKGFRFEDTHISNCQRIEKMMAVLTIGVCWAHKTGEWRASQKPIRFSKHGNSIRPQNSLFRYGFDFIRELIINPIKKAAAFRFCLRVLIPPKPKPKPTPLLPAITLAGGI